MFKHPILGNEVVAGVSNQLAIARVIHTLHPYDFVDDIVVVCMDMLDQFELGMAGADDQDFRGAFQGFHDVMIEMLIFGLTATADRASLMMQLVRRIGRLNQRFFNIIGADVHDMGFFMIKPDDCVVMRHGFPFLKHE